MDPMPPSRTSISHGSTSRVLTSEELAAEVHANLTAFETEVTELERLWIILDRNRTEDPATFEIDISLWRPRRQALKDRLTEYWSAEKSTGYQWRIYSWGHQLAGPDRAVGAANLAFRTTYDALVKRIDQLGFLDFLQVGFLSRQMELN